MSTAHRIGSDDNSTGTRRGPAPQRPPRDVTSDAAALVDRLHKLAIVLPAMAQETAAARREAARLRGENAKLHRRVTEPGVLLDHLVRH